MSATINSSNVENRPPVARYVALLTQTSTADPTVLVIRNDLGADVVWARTSAGVYTGTLVAAFVVGRTIVRLPSGSIISQGTNLNNQAGLVRTSADVVTLTTAVGSFTAGTRVATDALITAFAVEIEVYP